VCSMEAFRETKLAELPIEPRFHAACATGQERMAKELLQSAKQKSEVRSTESAVPSLV
jgi:hypothetical protein